MPKFSKFESRAHATRRPRKPFGQPRLNPQSKRRLYLRCLLELKGNKSTIVASVAEGSVFSRIQVSTAYGELSRIKTRSGNGFRPEQKNPFNAFTQETLRLIVRALKRLKDEGVPNFQDLQIDVTPKTMKLLVEYEDWKEMVGTTQTGYEDNIKDVDGRIGKIEQWATKQGII